MASPTAPLVFIAFLLPGYVEWIICAPPVIGVVAIVILETRKHPAFHVRPWVRFWARWIDIQLAGDVVVGGIAIAHPAGVASLLEHQLLWTMLIFFVWAFVEAVLLSTWGTTPGKWLLRVTVTNENFDRLTFGRALGRSLLVFVKGLGFALPLISTILLIVAYIRLKLQGVCAWDLDVGSRVVHARVGALRTIAAVFVIVVGVPFLVLLVPIVVAMVSS